MFCNIKQIGQISLPDCIYFPSCSLICVSCFMLRHFMTSSIQEFSMKNKKTFLLVSQVLLFRHTKQTSKILACTTFKLTNLCATYFLEQYHLKLQEQNLVFICIIFLNFLNNNLTSLKSVASDVLRIFLNIDYKGKTQFNADTETVARRSSVKKMFLKILQNSYERTCVGVLGMKFY